MDAAENDIGNSNEPSPHEEGTASGSVGDSDINPNRDSDPYSHIQPPLVARTKGSKRTDATHKSLKKKPPPPACPEPELDEFGKPKGTRMCSTCNKIDGHNSRSCKKKQLAK
jgi:hypothetical protein